MKTIESIGKFLIIAGAIIIIVGVFLAYGPKIPFLGKLPGDIYIKRDNFSFYFPITTCIVISIILSVLFFFIHKFK